MSLAGRARLHRPGHPEPRRSERVYISTTVDPRNDSPSRRHEIFRGQTGDDGQTWTWTAEHGTLRSDPLRPFAVAAGDATVLVWFRGTMSRSQHYDPPWSARSSEKMKRGEKDPVFSVGLCWAIRMAPWPCQPSIRAGGYDVYAFFWCKSGRRRTVPIHHGRPRARSNYVTHRMAPAQQAEPSQFASEVATLANGNRLLYRVYLVSALVKPYRGPA